MKRYSNFKPWYLIIVLSLSTSMLFAVNPANVNSKLSFKPVSHFTDGWRYGVGTGYALYVGDQMDFRITNNYGEFKELRPNFTLGAYKQTGAEKEFGFVLKMGSFQTLKSNNTQGIQCDFQELQFNWQRSLNDNINLTGQVIGINLQLGLGAIYYKSQYFMVDPLHPSVESSEILSSVGYGYENRTEGSHKYKDIPNKKFAAIGNIGFNFGFRISRHINLYWENTLQITSTNKLSGNLYKTSKIPPDAYLFTGLALYVRFGANARRLACSRYQF